MSRKSKKFNQRFHRSAPKLRTATQAFEMLKLSESAMRKLALGEELTDAEVTALFESDYVKEGSPYPELLSAGMPLYESPGSLSDRVPRSGV